MRQRSSGVWYRLVTGLLLVALLALAGCGPPASLKKRPGYWADQSVHAEAWNHRIRFLVLHYTGDDDKRALHVLTGPHVSVHYLVNSVPDQHGGLPIVRQLVPERERAWHAGKSSWAGRTNLNDTSIGIEIVNRGPINAPGQPRRWQPFGKAQIHAVIALARDIINRYDIKPANVVGHADIAPERKIDPGPAFPWHRLFEAGIGAWPDPMLVASYRKLLSVDPPDMKTIQRHFARYGYGIEITGILDKRTKDVIRAFQMHFRPNRITCTPDLGTLARLWALDAQYR